MRISHGDAITLEMIVRHVHDCDRAGMGGYIDADHYESDPFDAALIAIAPLWKRAMHVKLRSFCLSGTISFAGAAIVNN